MSTRSIIALDTGNNRARGVYCHSDGYPEWTGFILHDTVRSTEQATTLINRGNMNGLSCTGTPDYYNEDEPMIEFSITDILTTAREWWVEYVYLWKPDGWRVWDRHTETTCRLEDHPKFSATIVMEHRKRCTR